MNTLSQFFAHPLFEVLGWALLHSLWQGLLILLLVMLILHFIPSRKATLRYGFSLAGMAAIPLAGIATVWYLLPENPTVPSTLTMALTAEAVTTEGSLPLLNEVAAYVEHQMPLILTAWIAGVLLCSLRLAWGWIYISRLKRTAIPVGGYWHELVADLARELRLKRVVQLAESAHIDAPAVIGIAKPFILVPIGMFTGLSTSQVEAVLLHELTHIRRHDFVVNLVQSFLEVIYFFNPFVWMVSSLVRDEREFCCDDEVVSQYNPRLYAEALAYLETARTTKTRLSLSLTGGKNDLLHRIKRFMEKSEQNNFVPQWVIPAALGAVAFVSTSWLSIGDDPAKDASMIKAAAVFSVAPADTVSPPKEKQATYTRKKIVTINGQSEPQEERAEEFDVDEDLRFQIRYDYTLDTDFETDSSRWQAFVFDTFPDPLQFEYSQDFQDFHFQFDLPDSFPPVPQHHWDVDAFREEFESMFKEKFSEFYKDHAQDLDAMMDKMEEKFQHLRSDTTWQRELRRSMREVERNMERLHEKMEKSRERNDGAMRYHREAMQKHQAMMLASQRELRSGQELQRQQQDLAAASRKFEAAGKKMHEQLEKKQSAMQNLRKHLIKDGYLKKDEPLRSFQWSNDGMRVNGKEIKPKDAKRYEKLNNDWIGN